jgi:hypothetical protein
MYRSTSALGAYTCSSVHLALPAFSSVRIARASLPSFPILHLLLSEPHVLYQPCNSELLQLSTAKAMINDASC